MSAPEGARTQPVIIGLGLEAPTGLTCPGDFAEALEEGRSLLTPLPRDRGWDLDMLFGLARERGWGTVPDRGGFLPAAGDFDPGFFGIAPREAGLLDPQHRVALRCAWSAVENAGVNPDSVAGADAGVFIGASHTGYGAAANRPDDTRSGFRMAGYGQAGVAGRIAHALGLHGPAMTVDAACSSALVALHQAFLAVSTGDCEWAIAGGVCVMASEFPWVEFSRAGALDPAGVCRPYSAAAGGTLWGEGAALFVVAGAEAAARRGHRVLGTILASGVNHNGAGAPIAVPSAEAQRELFAKVLGRSGRTAAEIGYVEGHGTATQAGDPAEIGAVGAVYGSGRRDPVLLGSVKSNAGHAQSAAGALGLAKTLLAGIRGVIPPSLHAEPPTPSLAETDGRVAVPTTATPWPGPPERRFAAVNAFGVTGTNAHLIIHVNPEEA